MRAAILLAGPSLADLPAIPACDVSIAVKRAALAFPCHWAAILDSPALVKLDGRLIGEPQLLTRRDYRPKYSSRPGIDVEDIDCPLSEFQSFTSSAALALAGHLGATRIDAYGADFGEGDRLTEFDGYTPDDLNHSPERWARERRIWNDVAAWLAGRGCQVNRIGYGLAR